MKDLYTMSDLTLRDYFAAKAMQAIVHADTDDAHRAAANVEASGDWIPLDYETIAIDSYRMADAMLRARSA